VKKSYTAFVLVSRLQSELNRLFQEALQLQDPSLEVGEWQPEIDIVEDAATVRVLAEVPGLAAADLTVEVLGGVLRISGVKRVQPPQARGLRFHRVERERGRFAREVRLLWPINTHQGRARLADGLLTIVFPKVPDQRQRSRALPIEEEERKE
jgi:HSP20 family protein